MNRVKADEVSGTLTNDVAKTDEQMEQVFAQLEDLEKQFNDSELESCKFDIRSTKLLNSLT